MIIKEVTSKKATNSLKGLVNYMNDTENGNEKVDFVSVTNCLDDDLELAVKSIENSQNKNTRTKTNKTMHLVVSFSEGEKPNRSVISDIEDEICKALKMPHHQRISIAHDNTDNYHLHMAINRIDPITNKIVNNKGYLKDLSTIRKELEVKHDLLKANEVGSSQVSNEIDIHSGQQSLLSWCNENVKEKLDDVLSEPHSWDDIHSVFDSVGLELKKSGRGLVVYNQDNNTAVKASTISRDLSITKLQRKIGTFKQSKHKNRGSSEFNKQQKQDPLFTQYKTFTNERTQKKESSLDSLRLDVFQQREIAKAENAYRRSKIKENTILTSAQKFNSYQRLAAKNKAVSSVITTEYAKVRKSIYNQYGNMTFQQYLCYEAANGNEEALKRLRAKANHQITRNGLSGDKDKRVTQFDNINVDKQGILHYQVGSNTILDNGKQLTTKSEGLQAHKQLLEMAIIKYGNNLTINGSNEFKEQIKQSAEMLNLNIKLNGEHIQSHDPVSQFIDKRNQDKEKINTILEHQLYKDEQGKFEYDGYRNIGNQSVVLLKKDNVLFVKPIEKKMLSHYKSMKKGASITIGSTSPDKANQLER